MLALIQVGKEACKYECTDTVKGVGKVAFIHTCNIVCIVAAKRASNDARNVAGKKACKKTRKLAC